MRTVRPSGPPAEEVDPASRGRGLFQRDDAAATDLDPPLTRTPRLSRARAPRPTMNGRYMSIYCHVYQAVAKQGVRSIHSLSHLRSSKVVHSERLQRATDICLLHGIRNHLPSLLAKAMHVAIKIWWESGRRQFEDAD